MPAQACRIDQQQRFDRRMRAETDYRLREEVVIGGHERMAAGRRSRESSTEISLRCRSWCPEPAGPLRPGGDLECWAYARQQAAVRDGSGRPAWLAGGHFQVLGTTRTQSILCAGSSDVNTIWQTSSAKWTSTASRKQAAFTPIARRAEKSVSQVSIIRRSPRRHSWRLPKIPGSVGTNFGSGSTRLDRR
jgi:hypothetical protein